MIYRIFIPIALLFVPWLLVRYVFKTKQTADLPYVKHAGYLVAAAVCWVLAMVLPNIPISLQTDTFTMHSMGGVVATILFLYATRVYQITFKYWWQPWLALYFFVSGFGVLNELFEFFIDTFGIQEVIGGDEWWDLLANTVGAFIAFGAYKVIYATKTKTVRK